MAKPCWICAPEKVGRPAGHGRDLMVTIQQGLREDGFEVSMVKPCRWFGVARRSVSPANQGGTEGQSSFSRADQGTD